MRQALTCFWRTGILSTFLAGLFALLPIVITAGIMAWAGGLLKDWLGPESFVGQALIQLGLGLCFVTDPTVASVLGWIGVLLAIWLLGALLKSAGKRRIEKAFHAAMERIPLVNALYGPVAQVVGMLQRDPTDKLQGMNVVYVPTSPLPMSGLVVFAAADSVQQLSKCPSPKPARNELRSIRLYSVTDRSCVELSRLRGGCAFADSIARQVFTAAFYRLGNACGNRIGHVQRGPKEYGSPPQPLAP